MEFSPFLVKVSARSPFAPSKPLCRDDYSGFSLGKLLRQPRLLDERTERLFENELTGVLAKLNSTLYLTRTTEKARRDETKLEKFERKRKRKWESNFKVEHNQREVVDMQPVRGWH